MHFKPQYFSSPSSLQSQHNQSWHQAAGCPKALHPGSRAIVLKETHTFPSLKTKKSSQCSSFISKYLWGTLTEQFYILLVNTRAHYLEIVLYRQRALYSNQMYEVCISFSLFHHTPIFHPPSYLTLSLLTLFRDQHLTIFCSNSFLHH